MSHWFLFLTDGRSKRKRLAIDSLTTHGSLILPLSMATHFLFLIIISVDRKVAMFYPIALSGTVWVQQYFTFIFIHFHASLRHWQHFSLWQLLNSIWRWLKMEDYPRDKKHALFFMPQIKTSKEWNNAMITFRVLKWSCSAFHASSSAWFVNLIQFRHLLN